MEQQVGRRLTVSQLLVCSAYTASTFPLTLGEKKEKSGIVKGSSLSARRTRKVYILCDRSYNIQYWNLLTSFIPLVDAFHTKQFLTLGAIGAQSEGVQYIPKFIVGKKLGIFFIFKIKGRGSGMKGYGCV